MATRKISTELSLSGEKEFNDQMKAVNTNLKALNAEMRVVSTSFNENASASDKLRARQQVLTQQVDQQKEKVRALAEMYEKCKDELGENEAKTDKYRIAAANAQADLNKLENAQRQLNKELEETEAAEKAARNINELTAAAKAADGPVDKLADELTRIEKVNLQTVGTAIKGTGYALAGLGVAGAGASVAITALATVGFKTLAEYAIEAANSGNPAFAGLAENLGLFTEASTAAKAALGGVLLPALEQLSGRGARMLQNFTKEVEAAGTDTEAIGGIMAKFVREAAEALREEAPEFIKLGGGLVTGLAEGIIENSDEISGSVGATLEELATYLEENADTIGQAAAVLVSNFGTMIAGNAPQLFSAGISMIENLITGLNGEQLGSTAADLVLLLFTTLVGLAPDLIDAGVEFAFALVRGILGHDWRSTGQDIINALWEGMQSIWDEVVDWFNDKVSNLNGTAYIDVYTRQYGGNIDESGWQFPQHATGLDYVPYDNYVASLHQGEMVVPANLATQLRAAGINPDTRSLGGGSQKIDVHSKVSVEFTGSLAQLARVLNPHIKVEQERVGPSLIT